MTERWDGGEAYELFMGRWSRQVASRLIESLGADAGLRWLDAGCGTGALLDKISRGLSPEVLAGVDLSPSYVAVAQRRNPSADVRIASVEALPFADHSFDCVVSGLVLNFIENPVEALNEWQRVTEAGGVIAIYVWDYADAMWPLRHFWDTAVRLDPGVRVLDEGVRFPICHPDRLTEIFEEAGLSRIEADQIVIDAVYEDFESYWDPFLTGQGPAPSLVTSMTEQDRKRLKTSLEASVPASDAGRIELTARAWTIRGTVE